MVWWKPLILQTPCQYLNQWWHSVLRQIPLQWWNIAFCEKDLKFKIILQFLICDENKLSNHRSLAAQRTSDPVYVAEHCFPSASYPDLQYITDTETQVSVMSEEAFPKVLCCCHHKWVNFRDQLDHKAAHKLNYYRLYNWAQNIFLGKILNEIKSSLV